MTILAHVKAVLKVNTAQMVSIGTLVQMAPTLAMRKPRALFAPQESNAQPEHSLAKEVAELESTL